jgi:hypothetical protein
MRIMQYQIERPIASKRLQTNHLNKNVYYSSAKTALDPQTLLYKLNIIGYEDR